MIRLLLTFVLLLFAGHIDAQETSITLQGSIQDGFLKRGIDDCKITLMRADSTRVECEPKIYNIVNGTSRTTTIFFITIPFKPGDYLLHVTKKGYDDGWGKVTIPANYKNSQINVPVIEIRKSMNERQLGEATVKATRIKVKTRGDTLVFDALAFDLPEGSMLQNLIEQLPGAKLNEQGEIFINGRKIDELTLNSKSLFRGDKSVLLENLPYFTVKELKVYERPPLMSVLTGSTDDKKEYVMDVALKNEYSLGYIANCNLAGGTHERYRAKALGFFLTETVTSAAFVNVNNINDGTKALGNGWGLNYIRFFGGLDMPSVRKSTGLSFDYQSKEKGMYGFPKTQSYTEINYEWMDGTNESQTYREFFLPTSTAFERNKYDAYNTYQSVRLKENFHGLPLNMWGNFALSYEDDKLSAKTYLMQWGDGNVMSKQQIGRLEKRKTYGLDNVSINFMLPWLKKVSFAVHANGKRTDKESFNRQVLEKNDNLGDYRHEHQDAWTTSYKVEPHISYSINPSRHLRIFIIGKYKLDGNKSTDNLFVLNNLDGWELEDSVKLDLLPSNIDLLWSAYDPVNSSFYNLRQQEAELAPSLQVFKAKNMPFDLTINLPLYFQNEQLEYRRDKIDTLAHRNMFAFNPSLNLKFSKLSLNAGLRSSTPGLMNQMPFRDERNPLNIKEGNPFLKNNRQINARLNWKPDIRKKENKQNSMRLTTDFTYYDRSVAQGFTYNSQTGGYTYRPENVKGNWTWNTSHYLTLALGNKQRWWFDNEFNANVHHSVDYTSVSEMSRSQLNKVETVAPKEGFKIRYTGKSTQASLLGELRWQRTWGHRPSQASISAFDYRYGVTAQHTVEAWQTTFNVDACMYSRRGYSSSAMNKDECVVNASVKQSLWRGKITLELEGRDILHQLSGTNYTVNAQGRTES